LSVDVDEANRVIDRLLQLHAAEQHMPPGGGFAWSVCKHCRREDGGRVIMPCPTTLIVRASRRRL
jgi:hypothetical protein